MLVSLYYHVAYIGGAAECAKVYIGNSREPIIGRFERDLSSKTHSSTPHRALIILQKDRKEDPKLPKKQQTGKPKKTTQQNQAKESIPKNHADYRKPPHKRTDGKDTISTPFSFTPCSTTSLRACRRICCGCAAQCCRQHFRC